MNECVNNNEIDAILLWDTMKMQIRSSSLNYARRKKANMKSSIVSPKGVRRKQRFWKWESPDL